MKCAVIRGVSSEPGLGSSKGDRNLKGQVSCQRGLSGSNHSPERSFKTSEEFRGSRMEGPQMRMSKVEALDALSGDRYL